MARHDDIGGFGRFVRDESGAAMVWNLFWSMIFLVVGGLAIDASNAWRVRAQLQVTADAAALAAAVQGEDQDAGRAASLDTALRNMPEMAHGTVLTEENVIYGIWDAASRNFTPDTTAPNAVRVLVQRTNANNNRLQTMMLRMVGIEHWDVGADSIAAMRTGSSISCAGATIMTTNFMDTGGGNEWTDGVCLYGALGVRTGGNDLIELGVRIGSTSIASIDINSPRAGSAPEDKIVFEGAVSPVILPQLDAMFSGLMDEFSDEEMETYSGEMLPSFIFDGDGHARVVHVNNNGWKTFQPGEIQPNTIYVVHHGMQFAGGVDASNAAFIVNGQIGVGGGPALQFDNIYMIASGALNFSGDVMWGDPDAVCGDGNYRAYLFSKDSLSLGGFGPATGAWGVIGAAPRFSPGGALKNAGGLYIEASQYTALGGAMEITGCGEALEGETELSGFPSEGGGSYLVQ